VASNHDKVELAFEEAPDKEVIGEHLLDRGASRASSGRGASGQEGRNLDLKIDLSGHSNLSSYKEVREQDSDLASESDEK